jgi:hypothetical protein
MEEVIGLIIKGGTALFLRGSDPGAEAALSIVNRYRTGDFDAVSEHNLQVAPRPPDLSTLSWKYGFFSIGVSGSSRLEPGPFDPELQLIATALQFPAADAPNAEDFDLGDQGQSGG